MENINPYNKIEFQKIFTNTEIYKKLEQNFGSQNLVWDKFVLPAIINSAPIWRTIAETPRASVPTIFSASVFYYLLPLLEIDYDLIYDLGCGDNMFKPYIPRLIGIGAEWSDYHRVKDSSWPNIKNRREFDDLPERIKHECIHVHKISIDDNICHGDISDSFNDTFVLAHQEYFQSIFSICALHFHPLHLLKKIVLDFASIIKVGGRGFLSVNLKRMIEIESTQFLLQQFSTINPSRSQYEQYVRKELSSTNLKFLILDIDLTLIDEGLDGNVRLVFER
jgi:hypothetical protein